MKRFIAVFWLLTLASLPNHSLALITYNTFETDLYEIGDGQYGFSDIAVQEDLAYLIDPFFFYIMDISDPYNLSEVATLEVVAQTYSTKISGDYAYLGNTSGLQVINISDPENPLIEYTLDVGYSMGIVAIQGNTLFTTGQGFRVFDISDPTSPVETTVHEDLSLISPTIIGNLLYSITEIEGENGLIIYDI
ncbi:hypothetical protein K8I28_01705, partial [bacterium]|nr:hypothetical protein [bacterium]